MCASEASCSQSGAAAASLKVYLRVAIFKTQRENSSAALGRTITHLPGFPGFSDSKAAEAAAASACKDWA